MDLSNSSLQPLFGLYVDPLSNSVLKSCWADNNQVNCSQVCNNEYALFDTHHPSNLVNCMRWQYVCADKFSPAYENQGSVVQNAALEAFAPIGLSVNNGSYGVSLDLETSLALCVAETYSNSHFAPHGGIDVPYSCSQ